jgi:hypothetical protein
VHDELRGHLHRRPDVEVAGAVEDQRPHPDQAADDGESDGNRVHALRVRVQRDQHDQRKLRGDKDAMGHGHQCAMLCRA